MDQYVLGIDIGGTKTLFAVVPANSNEILYEYKQDTNCASQESFAEQLLAGLGLVLNTDWGRKIAAIGIGTAGHFDPKTGLVTSRNLNVNQLPLPKVITEFSGLPVAVDNDTNAGVMGEFHYGKGTDTFAYVAVGTGIGMGLMLEGRLYRGLRNNAGELGHTGIDFNGEPCCCGHWGCLENIASGTAIAAHARRRLIMGEPSLLQEAYQTDPLSVTGEQVFKALRRKDPLAASVISGAARALGYALHNLVVLLDLELIVLGGGVPGSVPEYLDWVREAFSGPSSRIGGASVELTDLGDRTAVLGATIMAKERLQAEG